MRISMLRPAVLSTSLQAQSLKLLAILAAFSSNVLLLHDDTINDVLPCAFQPEFCIKNNVNLQLQTGKCQVLSE